MGACVSVNKDSYSNMKLRLSFGSKTDKVMIASPIKDNFVVNGDRPIDEGGPKSQWSTSHPVAAVRDFEPNASFGFKASKNMKQKCSKEERFFDSQPWLESDCEDDFFSVNGDFTPSRGSTPVHDSFSAGAPRINRTLFNDKTTGSKPEPFPTDKKKRLSELFQEGLRLDQDVDDQNISGNQNGVNGKVEAKTTVLGLPPRPADGTPFVSGANSLCSSERTPNRDYRPKKEKPIKSVQCCLPRVFSSRSFTERKKMSPTHSIG